MCTKGTIHRGEGEVSSNHQGEGSTVGLRTKDKRAAVSPGHRGAKKKSGFQNLETEWLCEEPPHGNKTFCWCSQQLGEGDLRGELGSMHYLPPVTSC